MEHDNGIQHIQIANTESGLDNGNQHIQIANTESGQDNGNQHIQIANTELGPDNGNQHIQIANTQSEHNNVNHQTQIFRSQFWADWESNFIKLFGKDNKHMADEAMFKLLRPLFKTDYNFARVLLPCKETKDICRRLLNAQVKEWIKKNDLNAAKVYDLLQMKNLKSNPLESPFFSLWHAYAKAKYGKKDHAKKMLDVLAKNYDAKDLIEHLMVKATVISDEQKLKRLALRLLEIIMKNQHITKLSDEDVFSLLQLDKSNGDPMDKTHFLKWVAF